MRWAPGACCPRWPPARTHLRLSRGRLGGVVVNDLEGVLCSAGGARAHRRVSVFCAFFSCAWCARAPPHCPTHLHPLLRSGHVVVLRGTG